MNQHWRSAATTAKVRSEVELRVFEESEVWDLFTILLATVQHLFDFFEVLGKAVDAHRIEFSQHCHRHDGKGTLFAYC